MRELVPSSSSLLRVVEGRERRKERKEEEELGEGESDSDARNICVRVDGPATAWEEE